TLDDHQIMRTSDLLDLAFDFAPWGLPFGETLGHGRVEMPNFALEGANCRVVAQAGGDASVLDGVAAAYGALRFDGCIQGEPPLGAVFRFQRELGCLSRSPTFSPRTP